MSAQNPLLEKFSAPHDAPPFDIIKAEHYLPAIKIAIEEARTHIEAIKASTENPTFENTIVAMELAGERLGTITGIFYNQLSAAGTDDLENLAQEIGPISSNFSSDIIMDPVLFKRVKTVYDAREKLNLTSEQATVLDDSYKGFVRGGALLEESKKQRLREINEELSKLAPDMAKNVKKSAEAFTLVIDNKDDLAGLPETAVTAAAEEAEERSLKGKWVFTLDYPSYGPFATYADNRALREKMWRAFGSRAYGDAFDNCANVLKIVSLKDERAKILGYKNHASYVLEQRMAKTPESVMEFLQTLLATYKPSAEKDLKDLKEFAKGYGFEGDIMPWDVSYYSEKMKEKLFAFSSEDLRPYFPLEKVLSGTFEHFSKLFNITFTPAKYPLWHEDVVSYDVTDSKDGSFMGVFYADFYPRKGKKPGAWMTSYREQGLFESGIKRPQVAIVCNFTKPTKETPSLLTHDEVLTLFHEMGHAMHMMLSNVTYASHSGTAVLWDFVELPSQVQENWAYEKETLDLISGHYKTGEKIPADLIQKVNDSKNFFVGWMGLRQSAFGLLDMAWHTADPASITDVAKFEEQATKDCTLFPRLAGPASTSFTHIFGGGYSAGYYSYKWAEVLDADTFELFEEKGLYDTETAMRYRNEILAKGGSEHPSVLYRNFRGRDADPMALLRREGLLSSHGAIRETGRSTV
ncbi:MAG: peptidase M3 [Micavibrio aeruginosavorus]|uniref:Peptidase M3 n=1 Tax=Micavibrio aeruginosavorus TaxID=349221 RepID=A0A2W5MXA7_9BACT|nr:MAG: peptidase M3 [Micavibrio aeruginosavorus]